MAGDTRELPATARPTAEEPPIPTQKGDQSLDPSKARTTPPQNHNGRVYERIEPPPNANVLPGGTANTAGGYKGEASFGQVINSVKLDDFKGVHKQPCVRDSLLTGIASGAGMMGIRVMLSAPVPKASNWAVGTFCISSFVAYEFCQFKRQREVEGMKRAVEIIDRKKIEREEQTRQAEAATKKAKEEEDRRAAQEAAKRSWKFW
ncbi:MAG: hypothetical protein M4579_003853 [Chaenotheca gracillima]|nr:MAG: hypothetical protein M4579_003853 [Chaenotheca gracillima]